MIGQKLFDIISSFIKNITLIQTIEKENYIELLIRTKTDSTLTQNMNTLLKSVSVGKRYILKENNIVYLWSISTFNREAQTIEETIENIIQELGNIHKNIEAPKPKDNRILVDISHIQNYAKPILNTNTNKLSNGYFYPILNTEEAKREAAMAAGDVN